MLLPPLISLLALVAPPQASQDEWLLVRGEPERIRFMTYERIAQVYIGDAPCRIVRPEEATGDTRTSRLVIGTPSDNSLVHRLTYALGITVGADHLLYARRYCEAGSGLVITTKDPDGYGRLILMTGIDEEGIFNCLQAPLSLGTTGFAVIKDRMVTERGSLPLRFDTSSPSVVRLDRLSSYLLEESERLRGDEQVLRVARGLRGYEDVFTYAGATDVLAYARWLVEESLLDALRTDAFFEGRDLEQEIRDIHRRCTEKIGVIEGPQPAYHLIYGFRDGLKALSFGNDPVTGRRRILVNLCAMREERDFDAVLINETVHALQSHDPGKNLLECSMYEGVAAYLTQEVDPTLRDSDVLHWTPEQLKQARDHEAKILAAFRRDKESQDMDRGKQFLDPAKLLADVPGAPSCSGTYVGFLAVRAWRRQNPDALLGELLTVPAAEVFAALP